MTYIQTRDANWEIPKLEIFGIHKSRIAGFF